MTLKQQTFILTATIPVEDNFDALVKLLKFTSYEKEYLPVLNDIHKMTYKFGPLTLEQVQIYKDMFKRVYLTSPFRSLCSFTVSEIQ